QLGQMRRSSSYPTSLAQQSDRKCRLASKSITIPKAVWQDSFTLQGIDIFTIMMNAESGNHSDMVRLAAFARVPWTRRKARPPSGMFPQEVDAVMHRQAAVDRHNRPGDISAGAAGQKDRRARNVVRRTDPAERHQLAGTPCLVVGADESVHHAALERSGREGIDRD